MNWPPLRPCGDPSVASELLSELQGQGGCLCSSVGQTFVPYETVETHTKHVLHAHVWGAAHRPALFGHDPEKCMPGPGVENDGLAHM